ncbi:hypothetical protein EZS27_021373 [termite gut metagenome]|uniref:Uncharacterized protein n=1 Tax=termite gut metagenome TaxID=433724 RepID=A0A5J4RAU8_9ZZZZ
MFGGRYKRISRRTKGKSLAEFYEYKAEQPGELETLSEQEKTDLFYGDESHVCSARLCSLRLAIP